MRKIIAVFAFLAALLPGLAYAQSTCPSIIFGAILSAGQWNACFAAKQDALNFAPLNSTGGTMTGPLITTPSIAGAAGFNIPNGVAPTTPNTGDIWATAAGLFGYNGTSIVGLGTKAPSWNGGYVAGRYYLGWMQGGPSAVAFSANIAYFIPFLVGELHTFDRIAIQVTTSGTANNARLAIYNVVGGQPTTLVVDGGAVTGVNPLQTTGIKSVTINQTLSPGAYALAMVVDGSVTVEGTTGVQIGNIFISGVTDFVNADTQINATLTFGAFPATAFSGGMGTITYSVTGWPMIGLRG